MIVLKSPFVVDALTRCAAIEQRLALTRAFKAPNGTVRFDDAVAEAVKANNWPRLKAREALRQAVANGELTAHDHECQALTVFPEKLEDHHVVSAKDLSTWLDRFRALAPPAAAQPTPPEVTQRADASDPSESIGEESTTKPAAGDTSAPKLVAAQAKGLDPDRQATVERAVSAGLKAIRDQFRAVKLTELPSYLIGTQDLAEACFVKAAEREGLGERAAAEQYRQLVRDGLFGPKGRRVDRNGQHVDHRGKRL